MNRRAVLLSGTGALAVAATALFGRGRSADEDSAAGSQSGGPSQPGAAPALGMNLTPISYWTPLVFIDRIKASSGWSHFGVAAPLDALGFPQSLGGKPFISALMPCEAGTYILTHDGDLDARLQGATVRSQKRGRVVFEADGAVGAQRQMLLGAIRKPPSFMHLVKEEHAAAFAAGEIFAPEFLAQVKGFDTLRCMDWMRTNGSAVTDHYTPVNVCTYAGNVPVEVIGALAKRIGAHPWICIPHLATDDLARSMIGALKAGLDGGPAPYLEYSNEVWNRGFDQGRYAGEQATRLWGAGASAATYYGYRAGQLAKLARGSGCRVVLGGQTMVPERADQIWDGVRRAGADDRDFAAWIVATYVNGSLTSAAGPTLALAARHDIAGAVDNILHSTDPGAMSVATMARVYAQQGRIAAAHGLKLIAYEGNMHLNAAPFYAAQVATVVPFFEAVIKDPAAAKVMDANLDAFAAAGGSLACLFNLSSAAGNFGAFGLYDTGGWSAIQRRLAAHH